MVENLRSVVSKVSLITVQEMMEQLPKQLVEQELETMTQVLMKKSSDSNAFMAAEADKCLITMCNNLSEGKMLQQLANYNKNKNPVMRGQLSKCYAAMLINAQKKKSSAEKPLLKNLGEMLSDASQEVRNIAKESLKTYHSQCKNE